MARAAAPSSRRSKAARLAVSQRAYEQEVAGLRQRLGDGIFERQYHYTPSHFVAKGTETDLFGDQEEARSKSC